LTIPIVGEDADQLGVTYTAGAMQNAKAILEKRLAVS
jgi:hypothetical protein